MNLTENVLNITKKYNFADSENKIFSDNLQEVEYQKGESILKQGVTSNYLFFISSGLVKLVLEGDKGKNLIVEILTENELIGVSGLYFNKIQSYSAIALKNTSILFIELSKLHSIAETNILFSQFLFKEIQKFNSLLIKKLNILGNKQIHGRFASSLLYLSSEKFKAKRIFSHFSRKELAELSGISIDSAMKLINEFKNEKIIAVNNKTIEIKDMEMMQRLLRIG